MDLNIEDLNKIVSIFLSNNCSDLQTEQCLKKLKLYTSENDILLSHLSSNLISAKNQANCLFKSLTALHYTINKGDQKFLHYLASNNLNFVNLDKSKHKFNNVNLDYLNFLKRYIKYLQQKISVYKFINMESSWLTKLTQKTKHSNQQLPVAKTDETVLQHDIIGEQLMRKIGFIDSQIDYLITEFNLSNLNQLLADNSILDNSDPRARSKLLELVVSLLLNDVINYGNYYQDIMGELIEQFELMNRKHCKDAIDIYRQMPEKIQILRKFIVNCNRNLMEINGYQSIDSDDLIEPSIELQEKMENTWKKLESKPKRKNSLRRKEKSKYAARIRRSEESDLLNELSELVPLPDVKLQDKASVMRLAIAFINTKQFVQNYFELNNSIKNLSTKSDDLSNGMDCLDVLKTSNLILTLLTLDGDLVFISPNVVNLIGLKQTEMLGMSIFDFVHPCDHDELRSSLKKITEQTNLAKENSRSSFGTLSSQLETTKLDSNSPFEESKNVSFMVRIKSTLNNKSKCVPLKSASYKMASFSGYLKESKNRPLLVLSVDILLSPSAQLKCADTSVFVTKHTPDLKFINTDEKLTTLFGYDEKDLIGCSFFQYIHASDAFKLFNSFEKLLSKGEVETGYYRLLCKTGGYFWIQTKASLLTDYSTQKPQTILCVHYLISELVSSGVILSNKQSSANTLKHSDENSIQITTSSKKGQRLTKKTKTNQSKITKTNLNTKVINKCYSPVKLQANRKTATKALTNSDDDLFVLKDSSNLKKKKNDCKSISALLEEENSPINQVQDNNFVHDCEEFDQVLKKIKFKEQFKREFEAQLNNRMTKQTVEPLFNTFNVFEPLTNDDDYCQSEPSMYNSPLIATPTSLAYSSKVDMPCAMFCDNSLSSNSLSPSSCISNDFSPSSCLSNSLSTDLSNDGMSFNQPFNMNYDLSPTGTNLSGDDLSNCELFESTQIDSSYIPEIDELKTKCGNPNSIFFPLTDELNNNGYYMSYENDCLQTNEKSIDYSYLAPQAGDATMSLDVSLDFDDLPPNLDPETEKLIKLSFNDNLNIVQNNDNSIKTNSTIQYKNSSNKILDFDNYTSKGKSLKIPNHFNFDDTTEVIKKPRTTFNLQNGSTNQLNQSPKFAGIKNSSVLLNLLVNGEDVGNGYMNK